MTLAALQKQYVTRYSKEYGYPKGSSETAIRALENELGQHLPVVYREFLLWMGDDKQGRLRGSEWFLSDVRGNTAALPELLSDNGIDIGQWQAPFCFFMHQGYMAAWFELSQTADDPECFFFSEASDLEEIHEPRLFSQFLKKELGL